MKGAYILSDDSTLFESVKKTLVRAGAQAYGDMVQLQDGGYLFTVFSELHDGDLYDLQTPPIAVRGSLVAPETNGMTACSVECRSETLFSTWMHRLSDALTTQLWVLDGNGVLWTASSVTADEIIL